jgi:flagellar motor switch protein FliN/FliY
VADTATEERVEQTEAAEPERATDGEEVKTAALESRPPDAAHDSEVGAGEGGPQREIEFLENIELEAAVELGRATLSIGEVLALGPGSLVQLDKMLGDPVELMIKERLVARGEVVVVDDRFGLRITQIVSREPD